MKILTLFQGEKYSSLKKMILLTFLLTTIMVIVLDVRWLYNNFESGMGTQMAQVAIAYHVVLLLGMAAVGIGLGLWVNWMIRLKKSIFHSPEKGTWTEVIMNLWGYELKDEEEIIPEIDFDAESLPMITEPFVLLDLPTRRGRKPTFPLERWLPIAVQWENRDPIRDAFTLGELISEHLGTNLDGSPIVSEQAYYSTWRERAIAEIHRRAKSRNLTGVSEAEK